MDRSLPHHTIDSNTSMYLSFANDSTMSVDAFKTLEATNIAADLSMDLGDVPVPIEERDLHPNCTLEPEENLNKFRMKVTRLIDTNITSSPALHELSKRILNEFKTHCSTPSKENVRAAGSPMRLQVGDQTHSQHNKENTTPDIEESPRLANESSNTVIERKAGMGGAKDPEADAGWETDDGIYDTSEDGGLKELEVIMVAKGGPMDSIAGESARGKLKPAASRKSLRAPAGRPTGVNFNYSKYRSSGVAKDKHVFKREMAEIPKRLNEALKLTSTANDAIPEEPAEMSEEATTDGVEIPIIFLKKKAEKRFALAGRQMGSFLRSVSPAHKASRRSLMSQQNGRRSMLPTLKKMPPNSAAGDAPKYVAQRRTISAGFKKPAANTGAASTAKQGAIKEAAPAKLDKAMTRKSLHPNGKIGPNTVDLKYVCTECPCKFGIKALLEAHKKIHEIGKKPSTTNVGGTANANADNQCRYCDKKFQLVRALHIHLMQNCPKIPASEKRKLQFTELEHVEKAQLPKFHHPNEMMNLTPPVEAAKGKKKAAKQSSAERRDEHDSIAVASKIKKPSAAHAGILCTPSKPVPCHQCKKHFQNVLDYTNHSLQCHAPEGVAKRMGKK